MRFWDIILTANSNLRRNKVRTILTIIAVVIGAFTITLTAGLNAGVNDYINRQLGTLGGNNILVIQAKGAGVLNTAGPKKYDPNQSSTSAFGVNINTLDDNDVAKIKKVSGITDVSPQLSATATWASGVNDQKYKLQINQMVDGINVDLEHGKAPDNSSAENQIDLLAGYASAFGFKNDADAVGKTLTIAATTPIGTVKTVSAKVVGVQNDSLLSSGGSMVNNALISRLYDISTEGMTEKLKGRYLGVAATLESGMSDRDIDNIKDDVKSLGYSASTVKDQIGTISTIINAITVALIGFGAIALLAASFGVVNTLFMAVQERTREIGLMKAMGMSGRRVFLLFSVEAILLGFWGSLVGVTAAYLTGGVISRIASQTFLKDLKGFTLLEFPTIYIMVIFVVIMLIAYLAGTLPARRAARQNPIDALRYE